MKIPCSWVNTVKLLKNSDLILNMGYTKGYKNTSSKKISGDKSHFFTKFTKNFYGDNDSGNKFYLTNTRCFK